eukprot:CAMPEP_0167801424 /NCGR_PEP_ID=MMETSP0111_2-20121227/18415_1 /TAXON_ID=91324 /ORGANISM="Lotharella globosa, Strain CCCM811" /LENGTH=350 /DNA_ID=CAMNT_0007697065 /DNA_START=382 /DNA_END=1434 /DNA_ORIENTATION=+
MAPTMMLVAASLCPLLASAHWADAQAAPLEPATSGLADDISVVTVETRDLSMTPIGQSLPGVIQIGQDADFEQYGRAVKVKVLVDYLDDVAKEDPDKLVLFTDSDVYYIPSCPQGRIMEGYQKIKQETGAQIVFSAELSYYPLCNETCLNVGHPEGCVEDTECPDWPEYIKNEKPWLVDDTIKNFATGAFEGGVAYEGDKFGGHRGLNSGGFIGPASLLRDMVNDLWPMIESCWDQDDNREHLRLAKLHNWSFHPSCWHDQFFFWYYYTRHMDLVALDIAGVLFQPIAYYEPRKLLNTFVTTRQGALFNKYLKQEVCFLHVNGPFAKSKHHLDFFAQKLHLNVSTLHTDV